MKHENPESWNTDLIFRFCECNSKSNQSSESYGVVLLYGGVFMLYTS